MEIVNRPKLLYPSMVIAAIAVTVFSLLGIATLTGALPSAHSATSSGYGIDEKTEDSNAAVGKTSARKSAAACTNCGVVESVRAVQVKGEGSGLGVVAGGIAGALLGNGIGQGNGRSVATIAGAAGGAYAGNEIEKNTRKHLSYRVRVRMSDGSIRTLHKKEVPDVSSGDRIKIIDGSIVQQS